MEEKNKLRIIKLAPPPPNLPIYNPNNVEEISFIGKTNYVASLEEKKYIFGIKRKDRRRHVYIIGKSGVGKTKLMELLIRQDIFYGHGVCVMDPQGDLIENILNFIPKNRIDDVCLIDLSDLEYSIAFNPLKNVEENFKSQFTQSLIEIFKKHFNANWNLRLEHVFRFICLALLDYPQANMKGMISLLIDKNYRQKVVEYIKDETVRRFWFLEFEEWAKKFDAEAIIPLLNKLNQFFSDPMLRNIFSQVENKVDLEYLINNKKIILVNLAKGKIGEENASFFGELFLIKIKQVGITRMNLPEEKKFDFYLYIDEFQNIITETFENFFSETKKFGICLTIAHQYIGQLLLKVKQAILGNVGTIIVFRVGGEDAIQLKSEMTPVFEIKDMINLGTKEFYIKMLIDGESYDPFSAETLNIYPPPYKSNKQEIISSSRKKYSTYIKDVEKLIKREN